MNQIPLPEEEFKPAETLVQVRAPYFCAGLIMEGGVCVGAAPILWRLCGGKSAAWLRKFFKQMSWHAVIVPPLAGQVSPARDPSDCSVPVGMMRVSGRFGPSPRGSE